MRDELTTPKKEELVTDDGLPEEITLQMGKKLVDPNQGPIVQYVADHERRSSHSETYQYVTRNQNTEVFSDTGQSDPLNTTGASVNKQQAKIKAIVEALERYCFTLTDLDDFIHGTANEVPGDSVDPTRFNKFSQRQLEERDVTRKKMRNAQYYWTRATEFVTGQEILVPAQMVYMPFSETPLIRNPTSNGAAAHTSLRRAVLGGISEAIERECFVIHFLNELDAPVLDPQSLQKKEFQTYYDRLEWEGFEVTLLDITLDQPLSTCLAVGYNTHKNRMIDLGLSSAPTQKEAVTDAVRELHQISRWKTEQDDVENPEDITSLIKRAHYWTGRDPRDDLDFWLDPKQSPQPVEDSNEVSDQQAIRVIEQWLQNKNYSCYIAEVTTSDIEEYGFRVIKAIIPDLHPMYLIRPFRYLGGDRLYSIPVELGLLDKPNTEDELNNTPHPFL